MLINECRVEINKYLKDYFEGVGTYNKIIYDAASYSLNIGGKRIRPILTLLTYNMYKKDWRNAIEIAGAIEMIHTYSLVHDDLPCMDNDDLRRGMPTSHKKFGEDIAVLAGDALLNEAMMLMMNYSLKNGERALKASVEIAKASGPEGMIGGQVVDIINEGKDISKDELEYMHLKKTGELIRVSIEAGAILAEASNSDVNTLSEFGNKLGLAFQIKDDILDLVGDVKKLGKNIKSDENNHKSNFVTVFGLQNCEEKCNSLTKDCLDLLDKLSVDTKVLRELTLDLLNREF
ncbi:MAG: polyprenyl synthetase family protein [Clostridium sp.]